MSTPIGSEHEFEYDDTDLVEPAGHFRVYLGAAAGVGKTCAMLAEGLRRQERGADVVIAFVETHGRRYTSEQAQLLEAIPRQMVTYRGSNFEELDLKACLDRRPGVALVDELAHTNVPGSGLHEKRYQDVLDLLGAGIDVVTTVNIQHLESIADAVEEITGVEIKERVPDWVVRRANQIELVDSSPEQLRRRILHGNVYSKEKVASALENFFRTENLIALRELALRFLADETDEKMLEVLEQHQSTKRFDTAERILVAVTAAPGTDVILTRAARMAARIKSDLQVLHVITNDASNPRNSEALAHLRQLASDLGASWFEVEAHEPASTLIAFALEHQVTQLVMGSSGRSRFQEIIKGGSIVRRVMKKAGSAGIDVHIIARRERSLLFAEHSEFHNGAKPNNESN